MIQTQLSSNHSCMSNAHERLVGVAERMQDNRAEYQSLNTRDCPFNPVEIRQVFDLPVHLCMIRRPCNVIPPNETDDALKLARVMLALIEGASDEERVCRMEMSVECIDEKFFVNCVGIESC